jgi:hypothetical protein
MTLTGKCKEDFEKWYKQTSKQNYINYGMFLNMPLVFQYSVYVDFFDSIGTQIVINWESGDGFEFWVPEYGWNTNYTDYIQTRQEARVEVIERANDIYNLNHNHITNE